VKTYIIHIKGNENSEKTANIALESCLKYNYNAQLFEGITPKTLKDWDEKYNLTVMKPSHMYDRQIGKNGSKYTYECKYSNFLNHYTLWQKCLKLNESIIILEHDVIAVKSFEKNFDELCVLNMHSGLHQEQFSSTLKPELKEGIQTYENEYLYYKSDNIWKYSGMIPGTAAYAITPKGANRLIQNVKTHGWDKADYIINTKTVHMEYNYPDPIILSHHIVPNQRTSHGEI